MLLGFAFVMACSVLVGHAYRISTLNRTNEQRDMQLAISRYNQNQRRIDEAIQKNQDMLKKYREKYPELATFVPKRPHTTSESNALASEREKLLASGSSNTFSQKMS